VATKQNKKHCSVKKIMYKVARYKVNLQKPIVFLYTNNKQIEKEYKKTIPFMIA
jgi:hypothetical protein